MPIKPRPSDTLMGHPDSGRRHLRGPPGCAVVFIRDTPAPQLGVRMDTVEATAQCRSDFRRARAMGGVVPDLQNIPLAIQIQSPDGEEQVQTLY